MTTRRMVGAQIESVNGAVRSHDGQDYSFFPVPLHRRARPMRCQLLGHLKPVPWPAFCEYSRPRRREAALGQLRLWNARTLPQHDVPDPAEINV